MPSEKHLVFSGTITVCIDGNGIRIEVCDPQADTAIRACLEQAVFDAVTSTIVSTVLPVH